MYLVKGIVCTYEQITKTGLIIYLFLLWYERYICQIEYGDPVDGDGAGVSRYASSAFQGCGRGRDMLQSLSGGPLLTKPIHAIMSTRLYPFLTRASNIFPGSWVS
ncbi:Secondary metabolism regulator LAE1 [Fusarium oxysporum f. sp. albedinis]|nr:Secondary metabolism regulator LAE1 [Fusarium oxysporum f. sp. albedinis]